VVIILEIWKQVKGCEVYYEVSNLGNIKSVRANILLSQHIKDNGYKKVTFKVNGKQKSHNVHRLVAETFLPNPNDYKYVNHKDENKLNNRSDNLEWCSAKYNSNYGNTRKKMTEITQRNRGCPVRCVETGIVYPSQRECARQTGQSQGNIYNVLTGKFKQINGLHFEYADKSLE
jgi:hypothetical protein